MPEKRSGKRDILKQQGVWNPHADKVTDPLFQDSEFFDSQDLVQVKYEMLRRVESDRKDIRSASSRFGVSRPTFYHAQSRFKERGLAGLIPDKPGPRHAHKLRDEVLDFVGGQQEAEPELSMADAARRVKKRFGLKVHPRSIERAQSRREKKRR